MSSEAKTSEHSSARAFPMRKIAPWGAGIVILLAISSLLAANWPHKGNDLAARALWHEVDRTGLSISVIERGNLESQDNVTVYCEVEDVQRDGINGTPIVWIVENGSSVKKGDLLVELESTPMQEALDEQLLDTEEARTQQFQAEANYDNQMTQNSTAEAEAKLNVELARLNLQMYIDEDNGTHRLQIEEVKRAIDDINNEILAAQASMELKDEDRRGLQSLFKLGYANRNELRRSELSYLQAEGQYAAKLNQLKTKLASLGKMQDYERRMQIMTLEGKLNTAIRSQEQTVRNNEAVLAQRKSLLRTRTEQLKKEEERLLRYQTQLKLCKIYAPQDGMVAYASGRNIEIREGVPIRMRQHLLSIPLLSQMQVRTAVHESVLDQMEQGLTATITVDAFPDREYQGKVHSIAVLPDQNGLRGSGTKVYETVITIDTEVENLKPGMTAVAEIHIDEAPDVIAVPVQSILERDGETYCMKEGPEGVTPCRVNLGRSNDAYVEILDGIDASDRIALNPTDIADGLPEDQAWSTDDASQDIPHPNPELVAAAN